MSSLSPQAHAVIAVTIISDHLVDQSSYLHRRATVLVPVVLFPCVLFTTDPVY